MKIIPQPEPLKAGTAEMSTHYNTSCSGKVIVVGEHAVVYGSSAVAIPLTGAPVQFEIASIEEKSEKQIESRLFMNGEWLPNHTAEIVDEALELLGRSHYTAIITGGSRLPIGAGLGASASLAVGVLKVLSQYFSISLGRQKLSVLASQLEKRFHGNPSGLDTAVVAYEKPICFRKPHQISEIEISGPKISDLQSLKWSFAIIDSGVRASTKKMIEVAKPFFSGANGRQKVEFFDGLADQVVSAFAFGDFALMQDAINQTYDYLCQTGIVTPELVEIRRYCDEIGVAACKPTGAGGGGCMLALLDPELGTQHIGLLRERFGSEKIHEVLI